MTYNCSRDAHTNEKALKMNEKLPLKVSLCGEEVRLIEIVDHISSGDKIVLFHGQDRRLQSSRGKSRGGSGPTRGVERG